MGEETPRPCAVCTDAAAARRLWAGGLALVLFGSDAAGLGRLAAALRAVGAGRVAVFVGDPAVEVDRAAALAMAQEQFGATPVLVSSPAQARALVAAGHGTAV
jgi:hypothetical protein